MSGGVLFVTNMLLFVVLAMLVPVFAVSVVLAVRMWKHAVERGNEERVQAALDDAAETEAERSRRMDDGFNALMTYSVKLGHSRMTGGEP